MQIKDLIEKLDKKYPLDLQEDWDNSGLQVGNPEDELKNIVVSLDLEEESIDLAIKEDANLIITHHPYLFSPTNKIDFRDSFYNRLKRAIKYDISVYAFHTNLDIAEGGVNDNLAKIVGLNEVRVLEEGEDLGLGRYGLIEKTKAEDFIKDIKEKLSAEAVVSYGDLSKDIRKVGLCGGAGSDLLDRALELSCDIFLTGDVKYHDGMDYADRGLIIADLGHFASENHIVYKLASEMEDLCKKRAFVYSKTDSFRKII